MKAKSSMLTTVQISNKNFCIHYFQQPIKRTRKQRGPFICTLCSKKMKLFVYIAILLISTSLSGCFLPLPQWEMISRSSDIKGQVNDDGYFEIWVDQKYWQHQLDLVGELSWAENPDGERLNIDFEKSEKPYRGEWHYKIFPTNKKGKRLRSLSNGVWKLSLHLQKERDIKIKELQFKLWTFFYNPLIHGAPN